MADAELEIGLHRWSIDTYTVELRFSQLDSPGESDTIRLTLGRAKFDLLALQAKQVDIRAYGELLTASLFSDPGILSGFVEARGRAEERGVRMRIRLFIGPSAPELQSLRWEALGYPGQENAGWIASSERILFSRFISSVGQISTHGWQRIRLRPQTELHNLAGLVVIANPAGDIDVDAERERAERSLSGMRLTFLSARDGVSPTLKNLDGALRDGCDVLYLVCHGNVDAGEAWLLLEDNYGARHWVCGSDVLANLQALPQLPRLVVLISCKSAGDGGVSSDAGGTAAAFRNALGPRLAEVGVPAVLAMQGDVSVETANEFVPKFFAELWKDGQVDRAAAAARGAIRNRPDAWMPVLFMRLRSGRLWYTPRLSSDAGTDVGWLGLLSCLDQGNATPVLGPGLVEAVTGSRREIAQRWAEISQFPMEVYHQDDLPRVAQYLEVTQGPGYPRDRLREDLSKKVRHRIADVLRTHGNQLPAEMRDAVKSAPSASASPATLVALTSLLGRLLRYLNPNDPHRVLAELNVPLYVTTNIGNTLTDALREAGKEPVTELYRWNEDMQSVPSVFEVDPAYQPTVERPLVYHLFGHLDVEASIVLTEDDFFDYLIAHRDQRNIDSSSYVPARFAKTALLFLGFQTDDWTFRVLYRTFMKHQQSALGRKRRYRQVAVQLDVEEDRVMAPAQTRKYFEQYFSDESIDVYWGSADDFIRELVYQRQERAKAP